MKNIEKCNPKCRYYNEWYVSNYDVYIGYSIADCLATAPRTRLMEEGADLLWDFVKSLKDKGSAIDCVAPNKKEVI